MTKEQNETINKITKQQREIYSQKPKTIKVTCECGKRPDIKFAFLCYFCGLYFCQDCASDHFGDSKEKKDARSVFKKDC